MHAGASLSWKPVAPEEKGKGKAQSKDKGKDKDKGKRRTDEETEMTEDDWLERLLCSFPA